MAYNTSREDLQKDILTTLGHPIIRVNLTEDHLNNSIDYALKQLYRWHPDYTYPMYLVHQLTDTEIANQSFQVPEFVDAVTEILPRGFDMGAMSFATPAWQMNQETFLQYNRFSSLSLLDYTSLFQRLYNTQLTLGILDKPYEYNRLSRTVSFYFKASSDNLVIMKVFSRCDPSRTDPWARDFHWVWDNEQLKNIATAHAKVTWGRMLSKYNGINLPGSITLNGDKILAEGNSDLEEALKFLRNQNAYGQIYMG